MVVANILSALAFHLLGQNCKFGGNITIKSFWVTEGLLSLQLFCRSIFTLYLISAIRNSSGKIFYLIMRIRHGVKWADSQRILVQNIKVSVVLFSHESSKEFFVRSTTINRSEISRQNWGTQIIHDTRKKIWSKPCTCKSFTGSNRQWKSDRFERYRYE